jgi:hypothetical protein
MCQPAGPGGTIQSGGPRAKRKERTAMFDARRISVTLVALFALLGAIPTSAAASTEVPFRATLTETSSAAPCGGTLLCVTVNGIGQATHLGRTSESSSPVVDTSTSPAPGCFSETRTTTLTAANGDQITLAGPGQVCNTSPTTASTLDTWTVTGGTGRFSGASGSGTGSAAIDTTTGNAVSVFTGTLSVPRSP